MRLPQLDIGECGRNRGGTLNCENVHFIGHNTGDRWSIAFMGPPPREEDPRGYEGIRTNVEGRQSTTNKSGD